MAGSPLLSISYDSSNNFASIISNDTSLDGKTFDVYYRGVMPVSYRSNCVFYFRAFILEAHFVDIVFTPINEIKYTLGDPQATH